jgi:dienelactone hydrolase
MAAVRCVVAFVSLAALALGTLETVVPARAGSAVREVQFQGAPRPLGPLQTKLKLARGEKAEPMPGASLKGYLSQPHGGQKTPAVIVLHGCRGVTALERAIIPEALTAAGYMVLSVDSYGPRGIEDGCIDEPAAVDRVSDAYGALQYLATLNQVDRDHIGLLGISKGGVTVLTLNEDQFATSDVIVNPEHLGFKAAVAFYPGCSELADSTLFPLLVLVGSDDEFTPAQPCQKLVTSRPPNSAPVDLYVYPHLHHGFIEKDADAAQGLRDRYDEAALKDSLERARVFFNHYLK